jgi:ABC-2 type transport system ATP-binding protein
VSRTEALRPPAAATVGAAPAAATSVGAARAASDNSIVFESVSKFYGDVLGVNRVNLSIGSGITSLVGPNGAGKTTLLNLMTGLLRPTRGRVSVLGVSPENPEELGRLVGYCTQHDSFPRALTGRELLRSWLRLCGWTDATAQDLADQAIARVGLEAAATRRVAGYSKGMRQRIKLALSICHRPRVLLLDEPLNGLDPLARAEAIALFRALAQEGLHVVLSSHILHEVDLVSDRVVMVNGGYLLAEGNIQAVRGEIPEHPLQVLIRCDRPAELGARLLGEDHVVEIQVHEDRRGLFVRTKDAEHFYPLLNRVLAEGGFHVEAVAPADEDVHAVYQYLIGESENS